MDFSGSKSKPNDVKEKQGKIQEKQEKSPPKKGYEHIFLQILFCFKKVFFKLVNLEFNVLYICCNLPEKSTKKNSRKFSVFAFLFYFYRENTKSSRKIESGKFSYS